MTSPGNQFLRASYDMGAGYSAGGAPSRRPPTDGQSAAEYCLALLEPPEWHAQAACKGKSDLFYPPEGTSKADYANFARRAKAICEGCPVQAQCLEAGREETYGIWGGESNRSRKAERATRPRKRYTSLSAEQVVDMRAAWRAGTSITTLASRYDCNKGTIRMALIGRTHTDVPDPLTEDELLERRKWNRGKLTHNEVRQIRQLALEGVAPSAIAPRFGITKRNAIAVINRETWQHVGAAEAS